MVFNFLAYCQSSQHPNSAGNAGCLSLEPGVPHAPWSGFCAEVPAVKAGEDDTQSLSSGVSRDGQFQGLHKAYPIT